MTKRDRQGGAAMWSARVIALAGTAIAGFLTYLHAASIQAGQAANVPLCGGAPWLDCDSVLNSPWASWLGVPVAAIGLAVWLAMTILLLLPITRRSTAAQTALCTGGLFLIGAAVYFTYVQLIELEAICLWCTVDHVLGVTLGIIVLWKLTPRLGRPHRLLAGAMLVIAGALIAYGSPDEAPLRTLRIDVTTEGDRWIETEDPARAVTISGGEVVLDKAARPILGSPTASKYIVEFIDPRCGRCARFTPKLKAALDQLGDDYAVLLGFTPAEAACNEYVESTPDYAVGACELSRIALAVWLADADRYPAYHAWMFERYDDLTVELAVAEAGRLVGDQTLREAMAAPVLDRMIRRDIDLAVKLGVRSLPGVIVGSTGFRALPENPNTIATLVRQLLARPNHRPSAGE